MTYSYQQGYGQPQYPPQGQYGQPPQQYNNQYAAPNYPPPQSQGQYGQYPPQGQYGQPPPPHGQYPPQGQYGAPPPQNTGYQGGYQQPPQQHGYGAPNQYAPPSGPPPGQYAPPQGPPPGQYAPPSGPPPGQYAPPSGPPPGQYAPPSGPPPGQYGQQHSQHIPTGGSGFPAPAYGQPTPPSLGYGAPQIISWSGDQAAGACRAAMKGFGTDEKALIRTLADKDPLQIEAIKSSYERQFGRSLMKDVSKETSGDLEFGLLAIIRGPCLNDAYELYRAIQGAGTNERALNDILLGRSNADVQAIKGMYSRTFHRNLEDDIKGDLSGKTERMFMIVLGGNRAEDSVQPQQQQADNDALEIYKATEGRMGTDEIAVCSMMATRNDAQIRAIADAYRRNYSKDLEEVFKREFSGHMEDALLFQLRHALNPYANAARQIERAMAGIGTDEKALARRIVAAHWNTTYLEAVKVEYQQLYRKDLVSRVKGELRGDFERLMLACLGVAI